jgi:hypothetical protein
MKKEIADILPQKVVDFIKKIERKNRSGLSWRSFEIKERLQRVAEDEHHLSPQTRMEEFRI